MTQPQILFRFISASGSVLNGTQLKEVTADADPPQRWDPWEKIPADLRAQAESKSLTPSELEDQPFHIIYRLAYASPYAAQVIQEAFGLRPLPIGPEFNLYDYQNTALAWMRQREEQPIQGIRGGFLCFTMGLGKTLTALAHILTMPRGKFPTLVVASKTVMAEWKRDVTKFFGDRIRVLYLHSDYFSDRKSMNRLSRADLNRYEVVLTTYDVVTSTCRSHEYQIFVQERENNRLQYIRHRDLSTADLPHLRGAQMIFGTPWERVVADESQRFANPRTYTFQAMMTIYGRTKWCLTGTPVRNYETDVWAQLRFLGMDICQRPRSWSQTIYKYHRLDRTILQMGYQEAMVQMPPKTEHQIVVTLSPTEQKCYDYIHGRTQQAYDDMMNQLVGFSCVLALFTRLRQACIAPYLITDGAKRGKAANADNVLDYLDVDQDNTLGKWCHDKRGQAGINSAKIVAIINILRRLPAGEKMVIFSTFTSCLDLVAAAIDQHLPLIGYTQVDGSTTGQKRTDHLRQFRTRPGCRVCLMSYKVGSEGLNLTEATHCIMIEPWWVPAIHHQAKARIYRRGQKRPTYIYNISVSGTIEDMIFEMCNKKDQMADNYLNGAKHKINARIDKWTLGRILRRKL